MILQTGEGGGPPGNKFIAVRRVANIIKKIINYVFVISIFMNNFDKRAMILV